MYGIQKYADLAINVKGTKEPLENIKKEILLKIEDIKFLSLAKKIFIEDLLTIEGWSNLQKEFESWV